MQRYPNNARSASASSAPSSPRGNKCPYTSSMGGSRGGPSIKTLVVERMATKAELEGMLQEKDRRIAELRAEKGEQADLVRQQAEHLDEAHEMIDSWIEVFDMKIDDDGKYSWDKCVNEASE